MTKKVRIRDCVHPITTDLPPESVKQDAVESDHLVNRCVARVTESLKNPVPQFSEMERGHLALLFQTMRHTHRAIRELLRPQQKDPIVVNAMPLVRAQLETLFAMCLIVEQPASLELYVKDGWKRSYIRYILFREECKVLPRVMEVLSKQEPWLEALRNLVGVTEIEKATIDEEELGTPLPSGGQRKPIKPFPTPGGVLKRLQDSDRKRMLMRLYPEYQYLCTFVHASANSRSLTAAFDHRLPYGQLLTSQQIEEVFQKEIAGPAIWFDLLSVVQCASEFVCIYPSDIELYRVLIEIWHGLIDKTFIGRIIWERRTKKLLGALA